MLYWLQKAYEILLLEKKDIYNQLYNYMHRCKNDIVEKEFNNVINKISHYFNSKGCDMREYGCMTVIEKKCRYFNLFEVEYNNSSNCDNNTAVNVKKDTWQDIVLYGKECKDVDSIVESFDSDKEEIVMLIQDSIAYSSKLYEEFKIVVDREQKSKRYDYGDDDEEDDDSY